MDTQLTGKKALVTGSTKGIGLAIAKRLSAEGAHVIVNGRAQEAVDKAVMKVQAAADIKVEAHGFAGDLSTEEATDRLLAAFPSIDVLVNNLGIYDPQSFFDVDDATWRRFFEINVMSGVRLSRAYMPGMLESDWGRILFISSESAVNIPDEIIHYGMTKTAQVAIASGLANLTRGSGVTVNSLLVGPTKTEGVENFIISQAQEKGLTKDELVKDFFQTNRPTSRIQRFESPEEIAHMAVFLCSPLASGTNGAAVACEGGCIQTCL